MLFICSSIFVFWTAETVKLFKYIKIAKNGNFSETDADTNLQSLTRFYKIIKCFLAEIKKKRVIGMIQTARHHIPSNHEYRHLHVGQQTSNDDKKERTAVGVSEVTAVSGVVGFHVIDTTTVGCLKHQK